MSISGLLDRGEREICYMPGFGKGHLGNCGLGMKASSQGSKPTEELHRQTEVTSRV